MFLHPPREKKRQRWWLLFGILGTGCLLLGFCLWLGSRWWQTHQTEILLSGFTSIVRHEMKLPPGSTDEIDKIIPVIGGFDRPKTYLLLFENNTELRPCGGFIGVYAVVRVDHGQPSVLIIEGTETLDKGAPKDVRPVAPTPITQYLKVAQWYFRDSNWSPDFSVCAEQAMALYRSEHGVAATDIDGVIAFTPTVLEALLERTGPLTIDGLTFTAEKGVETLEYEVEYGYEKRGITTPERKKIVEPFFHSLMQRVVVDAILHSDEYVALLTQLVAEKQIMVYAIDTTVQRLVDVHDWSGRVSTTTGDYLLWVDANLAALKTDVAMKRTLQYTLTADTNGRVAATTSMRYEHHGMFDWRTTRYRTYARVFVPLGSTLTGITAQEGNTTIVIPKEKIDQGTELGKTWFGTFTQIEPGHEKTLAFAYVLPEYIQKNIHEGAYTLLVQKQLGTGTYGLTLGLHFGTTIRSAHPAEAKNQREDVPYDYVTDLSQDREFVILN